MRKTFHLAAALIIAATPLGSANAQTFWSTLGVVADSNGTTGNGTDNATALSALPAGTVITGDCKDQHGNTGGSIRIAGRWTLKSNLTVNIQSGCKLVCDWYTTQQGTGCVGANIAGNLSNVAIDGLYMTNITTITPTSGYKGKALSFWADHLTLTHATFDGFYSMATVRGSDQEWGWITFINSPGGAGNDASGTATDGLRHLGNEPKVTTTTGRPANVWLHDSSIVGTGDGAIQVAPGCQNGGLSADDYLYENSTASGDAGNMILVGFGAQDVGLDCVNKVISNVIVRNITGSTKSTGIRFQNANNDGSGNVMRDMTFDNITIDNSPLTSGTPGSGGLVQLRTYDGALTQNITVSNTTVISNYTSCLDVSGDPTTTGVVIDNLTCGVQRAGTAANAIIRSTTGTIIRNSSIPSFAGGGIDLGPTASTGGLLTRINGGLFLVNQPQVTNNTFGNVSSSFAAIRLRSVTGATVSGNTTQSTVTNALGASLMAFSSTSNPGATSNTVTSNDFTQSPVVSCAPVGQGNLVSGNTPAGANCP